MSASYEFDRRGDTLWIVPLTASTDLQLVPEASQLKAALAEPEVRNVVVDLHRLSHFGSIFLEWLVNLWRHAQERKGAFVLFRPTEVGREVITVARFRELWPIADTDDDVQRLLREPQRAT
jgi:anti-anti-sigma factor